MAARPRFLQLAARFVASEDEARLLAHAAAHLSSMLHNLLGNFVARSA
jgi:hypothetical protein